MVAVLLVLAFLKKLFVDLLSATFCNSAYNRSQNKIKIAKKNSFTPSKFSKDWLASEIVKENADVQDSRDIFNELLDTNREKNGLFLCEKRQTCHLSQ